MTYNNVYFDQGERKPKTILIDPPAPPQPPLPISMRPKWKET